MHNETRSSSDERFGPLGDVREITRPNAPRRHAHWIIAFVVGLASLGLLGEASAQTQIFWEIVDVETSLGSPLDQVLVGETVTVRSIIRNPANESVFEILGAADGYDGAILDLVSADAVSGLLYQVCVSGNCFGGASNLVPTPLVETSGYVLLLQMAVVTAVSGDGSIDPGLDGVVSGGGAQFEVVFEATQVGTTTVTIGRNPTISGPDSVNLGGGIFDQALTDEVEITIIVPAICDNGEDDDGDGFVDLQDPGCSDPDDLSEAHLRPGDFVIANFDSGATTILDPQTTRLSTLSPPGAATTPWDVVVEPEGTVWVSEADADSLSKIDPSDGSVSPVSTGGAIDRASGIARASTGEIFVASQDTNTILAVDPVSGVQSTILTDPVLAGLDDLLLDPSDDSLLVSAAAASFLHRVSNPLGTPSLSTFPTTLVTTPRQIAYEVGGDILVSDQGVAAPLRFNVSTGTDQLVLPTGPFSSLQGAALEPSGLLLVTDYTTGEVARVDDTNNVVNVLNVGRPEPGINHLSEVPGDYDIVLSLYDSLISEILDLGVANPGEVLELIAVVTNAGFLPVDQLVLASGLDPNLTLVSGSLTTTQGAIVEGSSDTDRRLEIALGSLAPGASATVRWQVELSDPSPSNRVTANAWISRANLVLAESDDPTTGPRPDPNVIGVGDYGILVQASQKLSNTRGEFSGPGNPGGSLDGLDESDFFGGSVEPLGDIDGDGVPDVAVGAYFDDAGVSPGYGSFFILLLNEDGSVKERFKWRAVSPDLSAAISAAGAGNFGDSQLGSGIAFLGDLDGAGPSDFALAVSAWYDDGQGGTDRGAVYILFMDANPLSVLSLSKIGDGEGGFPAGQLGDSDFFGNDLENVGDIDGDGVTDLAVGAHLDDTIGGNSGGVWILFLTESGTVKASPSPQILVTPAVGGDFFGLGIAPLGLFDGDAVPDIAVGATRRDVGGIDRGAVWILTLNADGTIKTQTEISSGVGGMPSDVLEDDDRFGRGLEVLPDLDGDGTVELVVGANRDQDAGFRTGAVYVLFLTPAGSVDRVVQLAPQPGVLFDDLADNDRFGISLAPLGDLDGNGDQEIAVGVLLDNDGAGDAGAVYILNTLTPLPEPGAGVGLFVGMLGLVAIRSRT